MAWMLVSAFLVEMARIATTGLLDFQITWRIFNALGVKKKKILRRRSVIVELLRIVVFLATDF